MNLFGDKVAQEFLKYFLESFTGGSSLCISVGDAREQLQRLEEKFPCASWLPIIVQNQLEIPPTWQSLGITRSPYRGLMAFREEDAENFFGREAFVEQLVIDVTRKPLVAVIGASGNGLLDISEIFIFCGKKILEELFTTEFMSNRHLQNRNIMW